MVAEYSFYEAIPGLLEMLPPGLQADVERFRPGAADASLANMRRWLQHFPSGGLVVSAVAPTIPHHCSDAFMCGCADLSREFGVGLHSHVQESKVQVITGLKRYAKTQTAHLQDLGLLRPDFTVAHGVWLDSDDMIRLADHGCSVSHNPASNMRLGNGLADMRGMLSRGVNVGIGTDGANCSDNLNMYENMRLASMISKVQSPDTADWITTEEVFEAATIGSAKALGLSGRLGRIAAGYAADIVFLDLDHINWMPLNDPTNQIVHTEDGAGVHSVMVAGRMVVEKGRVIGVDMASLAARVEAARERLEAFNKPTKALCNALSTVVNTFCPGLAKTPYRINRFGCAHAFH
jgi:5-methylthioadenosine/S-adenosylhomocysteine deaminase